MKPFEENNRFPKFFLTKYFENKLNNVDLQSYQLDTSLRTVVISNITELIFTRN